MRAGRLPYGIVSSLVVISLMTGTGCFGPFNLTKNVYHWNNGIKGSGEVNEKWMKEIVFFGMIVIPVYMFSALLELYLQRDSVLERHQSRQGDARVRRVSGSVRAGEATINFSWSADRRSATVSYRRNGALIKTVTVVSDGDVYRIIDEHTKASYVLEPETNGEMNLVDGDCRLIHRVPMTRLDLPMQLLGAGLPERLI